MTKYKVLMNTNLLHDMFDDIKLYITSNYNDEYLQTEKHILAYICCIYITFHINTSICCPNTIPECFDEYERYVLERHSHIYIKDIYNTFIHNWYYGNILIYLYHTIFEPAHHISTYIFSANKHHFTELHNGVYRLTRASVQNFIRIIYKLLTVYDMSPYLLDKDDCTLFDYVNDIHASGKCNLDHDQFIVLRTLAKHGNGIIQIQKDLIKIKVQRRRNARLKAVKIIETWWFDIITNPYTRPGQRLMQRKAKTWNICS